MALASMRRLGACIPTINSSQGHKTKNLSKTYISNLTRFNVTERQDLRVMVLKKFKGSKRKDINMVIDSFKKEISQEIDGHPYKKDMKIKVVNFLEDLKKLEKFVAGIGSATQAKIIYIVL